MPNITVGREGSSFFGDGLRVSWPKGGRRGIVPAPATLSLRVKQRLAEGFLEWTEEPANRPAYISPASRINAPGNRRRRGDTPGEIRVQAAVAPSEVVIPQAAAEGVTEAPAVHSTSSRHPDGRRGRRSRT